MKITVLAENTSACGLPCEHGLSLYIETGAHHLLFDSGQSGLFADNAKALGVDLSSVDVAVLSHGHYDHGGGLKKFLELNDHAMIYMNKHAFGSYYNGTEKYIGLDPELKNSGRIVLTEGITRIAEGLTLDSGENMETVLDLGSFGLNMLVDGEFLPDDFRHENYLIIEESGRRILISGCSHRGINNIESHFRPDVLIGGFHLSKLSPGKRLEEIARMLDSFDTEYYSCHCTGVEQYNFMKTRMRRLEYLSTGKTVEI
ncbi:MAG: MBL fold metallo-hydrolase [Clostridia bacterium]|nr:MBL fold metallo-hydrolase [Clostridia bacterium]